jgi:hypothetical protein
MTEFAWKSLDGLLLQFYSPARAGCIAARDFELLEVDARIQSGTASAAATGIPSKKSWRKALTPDTS